MGILNVTPDSFSDGGRFLRPEAALAQAHRMVAEGADIIDIGGESTRPGAHPVTLAEELDRVMPIIEALANALPVPLSIDTSKPEVMRAAASAGVGFINDVQALRVPGALGAAREAALPVCLMHMRGEPRGMQQAPCYQDVIGEVTGFLEGRVVACERAGIPRERLVIDPGFGFGKTLEHNLLLLRHLNRFTAMSPAILVGISRKSMLGALLDKPVDGRLYGGLAAAVLAVQRGARIIRTHEVGPTVDALRVTWAVLGE